MGGRGWMDGRWGMDGWVVGMDGQWRWAMEDGGMGGRGQMDGWDGWVVEDGGMGGGGQWDGWAMRDGGIGGGHLKPATS